MTERITTALEQLGYSKPHPTVRELNLGRYMVDLNGEHVGIWDTAKNTFVD